MKYFCNVIVVVTKYYTQVNKDLVIKLIIII